MFKYLKKNFGRNWWLAAHVAGGGWFTWEVRSFFGIPLTACFFKVCGPFDTKEQATQFFENNKDLF